MNKEIVYNDFLDIFTRLFRVLKPNGCIVFNHFILEEAIKLGGTMQNRSKFVNIARQWLIESGLSLQEVDLHKFDKQWWCCLQKR